MQSWPTKDPADVLDYSWNWRLKRLTPGDNLVSSTWFTNNTDSPGLQIDRDAFDADHSTVWLKGGVPGKTYIVTNHVTTTTGREWDQSGKVKVKEL